MSHYKLIAMLLICGLLSGCESRVGKAGNASAGPSPAAAAPPPDLSAAIKRVATQDGCKDFSAEMRMTSSSEDGARGHIQFKIQRKYSGDRTLTFIAVLSPRKEMDKALFAVEEPEQVTQAFSYLPGLKKITRLNSARQLNFQDARVTVQELLGMELLQYTHGPGMRLNDGGQERIKVEFKERPYFGMAFPRIVGFFRGEDQEPVRFELYDARNELQKVIEVEEVKRIQNHQTLTRLAVEDLQQRLKLSLETSRVEYDRGLPDHIFTEDHLKNFITLASRTLDQSR